MEIEKYLFEEWRPVVGYEGLYEVSNFGRVRSLDRYVRCKGNSTRLVKGIELTPGITSGYRSVSLSVKSKAKPEYVHRLVAFAFPECMYQIWFEGATDVNHRDENKLNNYVDPKNPKNSNLEWSTRYDNLHYGTADIRKGKSHSKKIAMFDSEGKQMAVFDTPKQASEYLKSHNVPNANTNYIRGCASGWKKSAYSYFWRYV